MGAPGLRRSASASYPAVLDRTRRTPVVSLDVPTGLDASSGTRRPGAVCPAVTVTLCLPKLGLADRSKSGHLYLADISVPPAIVERFGSRPAPAFARGRILWLEPGPPAPVLAR